MSRRTVLQSLHTEWVQQGHRWGNLQRLTQGLRQTIWRLALRLKSELRNRRELRRQRSLMGCLPVLPRHSLDPRRMAERVGLRSSRFGGTNPRRPMGTAGPRLARKIHDFRNTEGLAMV